MNWKSRWMEMPRFRKVLAVVLAAMILGTGCAMLVFQTRPSPIYAGGDSLTPSREGDGLRYTGQMDGGQAELTVTADGEAVYRWEGQEYGPYQLEKLSLALPDMGLYQGLRGVSVRQGNQVIFQGGYNPAPMGMQLGLASRSGAPMSESARASADSGADHAPRVVVLCQAALRDELHRGSWGMYGMVSLVGLLVLAWIWGEEEVFSLRTSLWTKNGENLAPSELYQTMEGLLWTAAAAMLAAAYWMVLHQPG